MNVSFDLLKIFKTVAFYQSISKAAKVLCLTQPSITKSIKKLENELNLTLFVRDKKGMILTDTGKNLYRYIVDSINTLDNVELICKNLKESDVGKLRIGAGDSVSKHLLKDTIIEYKKLHSGITIELHNRSSEQLYNDLRYGKLDLIFINSTVIINENKYKCFKLIDIEDCFFTTPNMYKKIKNVTNLKSILSESLISEPHTIINRMLLISLLEISPFNNNLLLM